MVTYDREFLKTGPLHRKSLIWDLEIKVNLDRKTLKSGSLKTGLTVLQFAIIQHSLIPLLKIDLAISGKKQVC